MCTHCIFFEASSCSCKTFVVSIPRPIRWGPFQWFSETVYCRVSLLHCVVVRAEFWFFYSFVCNQFPIKNNNKYRSWEKLVCVAEVELPMILRKYQSYTMSLNCSDKIFLWQSQVQTGVRNVFTDGRTPTKILWNFISHLMKNNKFCACIFQEWTTVILIPPSWIQG